jgi:hypothetical protein
VEIEPVIQVLEKTIFFLRQSATSQYARFSVEELISQLEYELDKIKKFNLIDRERLGYLFAPTGSLQDTSIDNGWGRNFLSWQNIFERN